MFFLAKYNTQTTFYFAMVKRGVVDLAATADWTPATGDTKISKDGGNFANTTNNPAAIGGTGSIGWSLTLTATELQAGVINIQIVDSATKAVEDQYITVYTFGNASAKIIPDWSDSVRMGLTALPNAAAEAAGGLFTRGTGAGQINQPANGRIDTSVAAYGTGLQPLLPIRSATAQGGAANSITLDASASATDGLYDPSIILIRSGTGAGQARMIIQYTGGTKVAIVDRTWRTNPDATSVYEIFPVTNSLSVNEGLAQGGAAGSITLNAQASAVDNTYNGQLVVIRGGAGTDQVRIITAYNGTTKVASVARNWETNPDNTSTYMVFQVALPKLDSSLRTTDVNSTGITNIQSRIPASLVSGRIDSSMGAADPNVINDESVSSDMDTYHAKVWIIRQSSSTDHYGVLWFKNGQPITSGITSPVIQVIKASDGSDLIASTSLVQIASTGLYKYDESTNRLTAGAMYFAKIDATIDGSTRTWFQQVGRDS